MHNDMDEMVIKEINLIAETLEKLKLAISDTYENYEPHVMSKNQWTIHNLECVLEEILSLKPELIPFINSFISFLKTI